MTANTASHQSAREIKETERFARIGKFFRAHRLKSGLPIEIVAQELGIKDSELIIKFEYGLEPLPLDEIFALTNLLNVPPEEVLAQILEASIKE